jgi:hypothetical protein
MHRRGGEPGMALPGGPQKPTLAVLDITGIIGTSAQDPSVAPELVAEHHGREAQAVFVGDRPAKDVAGPVALGMRAVRVRTSERRTVPDDPAAWRSVDGVLDAIRIVGAELERTTPRSRVSSAR